MQVSRSMLALVGSASALMCAAASAQVNIEIPLAVGFPAPGLPSATVVSLRTPTTNDFSVKAMVGTVAGPGITPSNDTLLWRVGTVAELVSRTGTTIAGLPSGVMLSTIEGATVNNAGTIVFTGTLVGTNVTSSSNRAVFMGRPRSVRLVSRTGDQVAGLASGIRWASFDAPRLSDTDKVVFTGTVSGTGVTLNNNQVVGYGDASMLTILARSSGEVPGVPGATFAVLGDPVINPSGTVAITAALTNFVGGVNSVNDVGVWSGVPGTMRVVQRGGDVMPTLVTAGTVDSFTPASINEEADVGYTASLSPRLGSYPNTLLVIQKQASGTLIPVAQSGQPIAPGVFIGTIGAPRMSGQENTSFISTLYGPGTDVGTNTAIFMRLAGTLSMLARQGDFAADCGPGVKLASFVGAIVNRNGRIAYVANLTGPGVTAANNRALFSWDRLAGTKLIARTGDAATLSPTDTRTISQINVILDTGNQDGKPSSLGDDGVLVFQTTFSDNSTAVAARNINRAIADIVGGGGLPPSDGTIDGNDFVAFINAFSAGDSMADIVNGSGQEPPDGVIDGNDFVAFINSFALGS